MSLNPKLEPEYVMNCQVIESKKLEKKLKKEAVEGPRDSYEQPPEYVEGAGQT